MHFFYFTFTVSEAKGVAKDVDFSRISYSTIIPFMVSDQKLDRKAVGAWLIPLIVHMTKLSKENCHPNVFKFKEHDADTPLHIAARLSVITGCKFSIIQDTKCLICIGIFNVLRSIYDLFHVEFLMFVSERNISVYLFFKLLYEGHSKNT